MWANYIVPSRNRGVLEDLHRKYETNRAVAQLLKVLRPGKSPGRKSGDLINPSHPSLAMLSLERDWDLEQVQLCLVLFMQ